MMLIINYANYYFYEHIIVGMAYTHKITHKYAREETLILFLHVSVFLRAGTVLIILRM